MSDAEDLESFLDEADQKAAEDKRESQIAAKERVEYGEDGQSATAESWNRNPQTVEALLAICQVDLNVWVVERFVCNKWDMGAKDADGEIVVTPLFQIKAWLIRKIAVVTEIPELRPIEITVKARVLPKPKPAKLFRAVIWPDIQTGFRRDLITGELDPFHDRRALEVAYLITRHVNPDRVVFLGDNLDLCDWSDKFIRSPEFHVSTQFAGIEMAWWYSRVRSLNAELKIDAIEGNHEFRMEKAITKYLPYSYGLKPVDDMDGPPSLSIERFLGLKSLGVTYHGPYPSGRVWLNDNLALQHGEIARNKSGATVRAMLEDLRHSEGQGHIHREELACKTVWTKEGPKVYMAFSPGTLARIDPGIVPAHKQRQNWQQGVAVAEYQEGNGFFNVYLIQIHSGKAIYDGIEWEARPEAEIVEQLVSDTGQSVYRKKAA
jgi:hypothetical protein